jgi:catechol 2,3-dioxygenase-like lactoylglutathione lyase family enzyme
MHGDSADRGFQVEQIDHVEMFVPGRREAAGWYCRVLGLKIVPEHEHFAQDPRGPLMISSDGGNTKLALFRGEPQGRELTGFRLVAFRVDASGFLEFLERLDRESLSNHEGRRVTRRNVVDHESCWSVYFCDPYGNRLEVTSYDYVEVRRRLAGE